MDWKPIAHINFFINYSGFRISDSMAFDVESCSWLDVFSLLLVDSVFQAFYLNRNNGLVRCVIAAICRILLCARSEVIPGYHVLWKDGEKSAS